MRSNYKRIGQFVRQVNNRNSEMAVLDLKGINISKQFMPSVANINGTDLSSYKVVLKNQFAYNPMHVGRDEILPIGILESDNPVIVSPAYVVFEISDPAVLLPEYLMMWCSRSEFDRNAWFTTDSSVRGGFNWDDFCDMTLPVPHPDKQREIVREYNIIVERIKLNNQLNQKLEESAQTLYKQWFVDFEFPISKEYAESIGKPEIVGKPYKSSSGRLVYNEVLDRDVPLQWTNGVLSELIEVQNGFAFKSDVFQEQGKTPIIKIKNITPPNIDLSECHYFNAGVSENDKLYKYLANYGDVLISMTGSQMNQMNSAVGQVGRFNHKESALINQRIGNLKPKKEMKCIEFVYRFISDKEIHYQLLMGSTGSANQANISPDQIKSLSIALPTPDVLEKFEEIGRCLMNRIVLNDETRNFLVKLKSLVMLNSLHGG